MSRRALISEAGLTQFCVTAVGSVLLLLLLVRLLVMEATPGACLRDGCWVTVGGGVLLELVTIA